MNGSAETNLEGVLEAQTAEPADEGGFGPGLEDGVRLVQAFVCIRSPERRQAILPARGDGDPSRRAEK